MYDIIFITNGSNASVSRYKQFKLLYPLAKQATTYDEAKSKSFTKLFWIVWYDVEILPSFTFDYVIPEWDQQYVHVFKHDNAFIHTGICVASKEINISKREFAYRYIINNKKEIDTQATVTRKYEIFCIDTHQDYLKAMDSCTTDMFWMTSSNMTIADNFKFDLLFDPLDGKYDYDRNENHAFIHREQGKDTFDGVFLLSKNKPLSKREVEYRFPIQRKEWDIVASGPKLYDRFKLTTYKEYLTAVSQSTTELFWNIPSNVIPVYDFKFDLYFSQKDEEFTYDRNTNHVFLNGKHFDGVTLYSKHSVITEREFTNRFIANKKEWEVVASVPKPFDMVFISYNELTADENYARLLERFPRALRVHGVKGIHQAHIEAAKLATTEMFWVVDADAIIEDTFNFEFEYIPFYNVQSRKMLRNIVHVWQSKNPINDLVYGYGGVKLLPRELTMNMSTTTADMTTSISSKFKAMPTISNITAFNTDPFNTWKSAFRECVKLSSKVIDGQVSSETEDRLNAWCILNESAAYGFYAYAGALAGKEYGQENAGNIPALSLINDFEWLQIQFETSPVAIGKMSAITLAHATATS
jgi:hypothetical protein